MPGRFMKLGELDDWTHCQYRYSFHTLPVSPGDGNGPRTFGCQSNWVDNADHTDEPPTREDLYFTVSDGMTNHIASPIPLSPLQHLSPWLLLSLPLYHHHPSSLPYHLLFRSPLPHLSFRLSTIPNPLSAHHLSVTFLLLPTLPRLPRLPCLLAVISSHCQPWTACTLLSTTSSFEGLILIYLRQKSIYLDSPSQAPFPRSSGSTLSSGDSLPST